MGSTILPPVKFPMHYYQPIGQSKFPPGFHFNHKTSDQLFPENSPNFTEFAASNLMTSGNTSTSPRNYIGSVQERLGKLEVLLPIIHDVYRGEIATLRAEIESLKRQLTSKTTLNKNATTFVPGPTPLTPTTPIDCRRTSHLGLTVPNIGQEPELLTPPRHKSFELSTHHDQIQSLSRQVNILSSTVSQLITVLLASPNGSSAPINSNSLVSSPSINPPCHLHGPPPSSPTTHFPTGSSPTPHIGQVNHSKPAPPRAGQRNQAHLTIAQLQPLDPSLPQNIHKTDGPPFSQMGVCASLPRSNLRLKLLSPTVCHTPLSAPSPLSPLSHEPSAILSAAAPTNSLAAKWEQLGITGDVLRAIVRYGVGPPSKTQQKTIPNMLLGKDLISQSNPIQERIQSYIITALQLIMNEINGTSSSINDQVASSQYINFSGKAKGNNSVKVLVITATLDEASQAHRLARGIAALLTQPIKIEHCGSSEPLLDFTDPNPHHHSQPHLLIGTPSKLLDSVNGLRGYTFDAQSFSCVILDEMDQLLARNLSDMVTSLMAFLPSNCAEINQSNQSVSPPQHEADAIASHPVANGSPGEWTSSRQLRQSPQNSVTSSASGSESRTNFPGRQTCIFSCTVPQEVLTYARTLNVRAKVIIRRDDGNNSGTSSYLSSALTPLASCFDTSDPRTPHLTNFPWTNQSGNGNSSSTHQLLRNLAQYYYYSDSVVYASLNIRERKLRALTELLVNSEVSSLRAGRGQLVIIYCNSVDSVETVSYALEQKKIDVLALYQDMGPAARHLLLANFGKAARHSADHSAITSIKALVVYDVLAKTLADMSKDQPSLVINYELPRAVEDYIHRAGCIINLMNHSENKRVGASFNNHAALINLVNNSNEMETVKSIESYYRCKIQQVNPS